MNLETRIREARSAAGMTQAELARATMFERTYLSALESGKRIPTLRTLRRLADGLKCRPIDLLGECFHVRPR